MYELLELSLSYCVRISFPLSYVCVCVCVCVSQKKKLLVMASIVSAKYSTMGILYFWSLIFRIILILILQILKKIRFDP